MPLGVEFLDVVIDGKGNAGKEARLWSTCHSRQHASVRNLLCG